MNICSKAIVSSCLAVLCVMPQQALAWGNKGHSVIAKIAQQNLEPAVWAKIQVLLATDGQTTMYDPSISSYADTPGRTLYPKILHSTQIPIDGSSAAVCPATYSCAVSEIARFGGILKDTGRSTAARELALKYVIHLIGDIHQPLHGSDPAGENNITLAGSSSDIIHAVWDNDLLGSSDVDTLTTELVNNTVTVNVGGTPQSWTQESSDMARDHIYDTLSPCWSAHAPTCASFSTVALPNNYAATKTALAKQRVKEAGYRLAAYLNDLLR